jgi:hypothetical protein
MEVCGQLHAPAALPPRERALGTHWKGGWLGPRAVLDAVVKRNIPSLHRESNLRAPIVQSVAQRYTDRAIMALGVRFNLIKNEISEMRNSYKILTGKYQGKILLVRYGKGKGKDVPVI